MKQRTLLTTLIFLICLGFGQSVLGQDSTSQQLVLGAPHPDLGGHIFYLNGQGGGLIVYERDLVNDEFNGLSMFRWAEPQNLRTEAAVEYYDFNDWERTLAQTDQSIIDAYGEQGSYAAIAIQRQLGGEWRLPTAREAYWINFNLNQQGIGNFNRGLYWTSSEVLFQNSSIPAPYAVAIDMETGALSSKMAKIQALKVRPVRAF